MVLGSDGRGAAESVAGAGRAAFHDGRAQRTLAQSTPASPMVDWLPTFTINTLTHNNPAHKTYI